MEDGRWRIEDGGWRMEDRKWEMGDGKWRLRDGGFSKSKQIAPKKGNSKNRVAEAAKVHDNKRMSWTNKLLLIGEIIK